MRKRAPCQQKQSGEQGMWMLVEGFPYPQGREDNKLISRVGWISYCDKEKCIVDDGKFQTTLYNYQLIYEVKR